MSRGTSFFPYLSKPETLIVISQPKNVFVFVLRVFNPNRESLVINLFDSDQLSSQVTLQCLGAVVAASASSVPAWEQGYDDGNVGGLLEAMLQPAGNFGKFLTVLLALSVTGNMAATFYSISLNVQVFIPVLVAVPRYVFSILATAM